MCHYPPLIHPIGLPSSLPNPVSPQYSDWNSPYLILYYRHINLPDGLFILHLIVGMKKTHQPLSIIPKYQPLDTRTFGILKKPIQPSMFQILTWNDKLSKIDHIFPENRVNPHLNYSHVVQKDQPQSGKQQGQGKESQSQKQKREASHDGEARSIENTRLGSSSLGKSTRIKIQRPITQNLYQYENVVPVVKRPKKSASPNKKGVDSSRPYTSKPKWSDKINSITCIVKRPPFEAYGRGNTKGEADYLKSHNVLPHSGINKPSKNQTYQSALNVKARSQLDGPRDLHKSQSITHFDFPEETKSHTTLQNQKVVRSLNKHNKKKGRNGKNGKKGTNKERDIQQSQEKKKIKEPPLKFMNKRGDFMQQVREDEVKKNRLALKPTECYPGQYNVQTIDLVESHCSNAPAAGKKNPTHEDIRQIFIYPTRKY